MEVDHQNLYGGSGIVKITVVDVQLVPPFQSVLQYKLTPTASIGLHQHQVDSALLICTAGQGTVVMNQASSDLTENDTVMIPCRAQVSIHNTLEDGTFEFWMIRVRP